MNLDAWRLRQIQVNALNIAQDNQDVLDPMGQNALTMALAGDWLTLDPKWNTSKGIADASFFDGIIHFMGKIKSWHADDAGSFQDRWFHYWIEPLSPASAPSSHLE
jgi:lipopolysaccharide biosynthesis glycosyltransferase